MLGDEAVILHNLSQAVRREVAATGTFSLPESAVFGRSI
jgi:hypothetical protein